MAVDDVRRLIGGSATVSFVSDDDLVAFLAANGNNDYRAAADAADSIALQLALKGDRKVEDVSVSYKPEQFTALANRLRSRAVLFGGMNPYAGGISKADKETRATDGDRVEPAFRRDLHLVPGTDSGSPLGADEAD
jgi:hypothetical protein